MKNRVTTFPRIRAAAWPAILGIVLLLSHAPAGWSDDRELLRFEGSQPYLFIHLDTSASMNLRFGGSGDVPTAGFGDDPDSRIYAAKEALFKVFENVNDVNFGFASFNQDELHVPAVHLIYYADAPFPSEWPLSWPAPDPDGLTQFVDSIDQDTDGDGIADAGDGIPDSWVSDVDGDALVFGPLFLDGAGVPLEAGTCDTPLDLDDPRDRRRADTYAKLGVDGFDPTIMWIESGGTTYRLDVRWPGSTPTGGPNSPLGQDGMWVTFELATPRNANCSGGAFDPVAAVTVRLRLDPKLNRFLYVDQPGAAVPLPPAPGGGGGGGGGGGASEAYPGYWPWTDAPNSATCSSSSPFTGQGWEGNYDGDYVSPDDPDLSDNNIDRFSPVLPGGGAVDLKFNSTIPSPFGAALDRGDMLPFDWQTDNKTEFLQRLAPNWPEESPDFGVAGHLTPGTGLQAGVYVARIASRKPLIATGETPLGKALLDFRCWYTGADGNKCRTPQQTAFFEAGWSQTACTYDSDYGCRKPFQILISDGADTCGGENPSADVASLQSQNGVTTWVLNLGDPSNCQTGLLGSIARPGGGECINVADKQELLQTIQSILGQIREEARSFASAAVPSVQATADQLIYVSNFVPLRDRSVWDGHLNAFLKPLPLDDDGRPDTTDPNFVWDAGEVLETQHDAVTPLDENDPGKRRVYYSQKATSGEWVDGRRLLQPTADSLSDAIRYDLWRGMGIIPSTVVDGSLTDDQEDSAELAANSVIANTLALKSATLAETGETITYLLGDIFHANPLVVGTPVNSTYFVFDSGADQGEECRADDSAANANRGYRCFLLRQRFRRKVLLAASNDGFVHAFNAGIYDGTDDKYSVGTGHELWAYTPREILPSLVDLASSQTHKFTVDGNIAVADAFIDPNHTSGPDPDDRLWRTVLVGSLRRGGNAYYALDITQPDPVTKEDDLRFVPDSDPGLPDAGVAECTSGGSGCGPVPYPAPLWEFFDNTDDSLLTGVAPEVPVAMDEDSVGENGYGEPDLGDTWSSAVIGRIRLCRIGAVDCTGNVPGTLEDRFVAIFGGGLDPLGKLLDDPARGDWIYMVDVETGKVLYKRKVVGSVPTRLAPIDADQDGYFERMYFGTTAGLVYRVDFSKDSAGNHPRLATTTVEDVGRTARDVLRIPRLDAAGEPLWEPRVIFDANTDGGVALSGPPRAIYHQPAVIFVTRLGLYGLVFGTGDREDLWNANQQEGRFYVFVDDTDALVPAALPLDEGDFVRITVDAAPQADDLLLTRPNGEKGWYLVLEPNEKVITEAFSLSGVTFFSSYRPEIALTDEDGDPIEGGGTCGDKKFEQDTDNLCSKTGNSRLFVVNTTNGNPFIEDTSTSTLSRHLTVASFVTNPFTERSVNKNDDSNGGDGGATADDLSVTEAQLMETLKDLFPRNCNFANYGIDIKTITAETAIQRIARVPVCLVEKNWKDF